MDAIAETWQFFTTTDNWWGSRGIAQRTWVHVQVSFLSLVVAALVAGPPAVLFGHFRRGGTFAVALVNLGRAVPSFGVLALVLPLSIQFGFGLGFWPTVVPLVLLGIPPIFANTYTGVRSADPGVVEAARGMGLSRRQTLTQVELRLATPLIITGLRVSAVQIIATATLGALVGLSALGSFITEGLASFDDGRMIAGGLLVAALAISAEVAFTITERVLTPWSRVGGRGPTRRSRLRRGDDSSRPDEITTPNVKVELGL